jgi:hypothetical protein
VTRFVDREALVAAGVGVGVAVTVGVSFLLVIPIEPIYWYLTVPSGLLIGYYANQRAGRAGGPWVRLLGNALVAGVVTGLTFAALLLAVKAIFFAADTGYPTFNRIDENDNPIPPFCQTGVDCVYQRYIADGRGPALVAVGVTDASSFGTFYWTQQLSSAGLLLGLSTIGGIGGGTLFGLTNRRRISAGNVPTPREVPGAS